MNQGHAKSHTKTHNEMERKLMLLATAALRFRRASLGFFDASENARKYAEGSRQRQRALASLLKAEVAYGASEASMLELCIEFGGDAIVKRLSGDERALMLAVRFGREP